MIPTTLLEWTADAINALLAKAMFESEEFDFKERLPDPRDEGGKTRLRGACTAFANASGGFIVFGVSDDRNASLADRLVGLAPTLDFPERFGSFPQQCVPSINWEFRNPPILLGNGNVLQVVQIPRSWKAPHAIGSPESGWRFLKRTNKGDEGMSMDEVRSAFLGFYEKRLRLQLLQSELKALRDTAVGARIDDAELATHYSLVSFDVAMIESILSDTYSITAHATEFLSALTRLRSGVAIANNQTRVFYSIAAFPLTGKDAVIREHNISMRGRCQQIIVECERALAALAVLLVG